MMECGKIERYTSTTQNCCLKFPHYQLIFVTISTCWSVVFKKFLQNSYFSVKWNNLTLSLLCPFRGAKYCKQRVYMPICLSVREFNSKTSCPNHHIVNTCHLWPWLNFIRLTHCKCKSRMPSSASVFVLFTSTTELCCSAVLRPVTQH